LAYAADLPPTEKLVRDLTDNPPTAASSASAPSRSPGGGHRAQVAAQPIAESRPQMSAPVAAAPPAVELNSLEDIVALAESKSARLLATQLESNVHLVSLERGRIQFRPNAQAPGTLASDLAQRLRDWCGERWIVTLASEGGAPTIVEQRLAADRAKKDAVSQEPFVRAVLDAFPGAEIVAVREREVVEPPAMSSDEESD